MSTVRRAPHFAFSVAVLVAVAAVPWALLRWVGWPLPTVLPSGAQLSLAVRSADIPDLFVIKALACVIWVAWADLILAFAWELVVNHPRLARGRTPRPSVLVHRRMAGLAAYVIAGLLTVATVAGPVAATPLPSALASRTVTPDAAPRPLTAVKAPVGPVPAPSRAREGAGGEPLWVARRGDTLWNIAATTTGDPERFVEVLALNSAQLTRSRDLRPGMILRLPEGSHVPDDRRSPPPSSAVMETHVVRPGESEWSIAQEALPGKPPAAVGPLWAEIVADNSATVRDPDLIYPGQTLVIPAPMTTAAPTSTIPPRQEPATAVGPPTPTFVPPPPPDRPAAPPSSAPPPSRAANPKHHATVEAGGQDRVWTLGAGRYRGAGVGPVRRRLPRPGGLRRTAEGLWPWPARNVR